MAGHAENAPETLDSLAEFLGNDTPEAPDEEKEGKTTESEPEEGHSEEEDDAPGQPEDEKPEDEPDDQTSARKVKVTVKGEDGADEVLEVEEPELVKGYLRQRDYSRKTTELAERERQAFDVVSTKLNEGRTYFMQQAQMAHAAVMQLAGLKSQEELSQLATTDPAAWAVEQQRINQVREVLTGLQQQMGHAQQQAQAEAAHRQQEAFRKSWDALQAKGFDRPKLAKLYESVSQKYGFEMREFAGVYDPRLVMVMRDAAAYQALKDKKPEVQQKAQAKLPPAKQPVPRNERVNKELNKRFQGGRAKVNDLAAFIDANGI